MAPPHTTSPVLIEDELCHCLKPAEDPVGMRAVRKDHTRTDALNCRDETRTEDVLVCMTFHAAIGTNPDDRALMQFPQAWESLSGNKIRDKTVFHTSPRNTTKPQVKSGAFEKTAHHFSTLENAPFRIICSGICSAPGLPKGDSCTRGLRNLLSGRRVCSSGAAALGAKHSSLVCRITRRYD